MIINAKIFLGILHTPPLEYIWICVGPLDPSGDLFFKFICLFYTLTTASPSSIIYFISGGTKINFPKKTLLLNGKLGFKPS